MQLLPQHRRRAKSQASCRHYFYRFLNIPHQYHPDIYYTQNSIRLKWCNIDRIILNEISKVTVENAAIYYAKIHIAIVHIHPFWDGNGRLARLLANIVLLKAGLPPLVIEKSLRREYIECLADYQVKIGQLTSATGTWPDNKQLKPLEKILSAGL